MAQYVCSLCGFTFDEEVELKFWKDMPESWECPSCGADKSFFENFND